MGIPRRHRNELGESTVQLGAQIAGLVESISFSPVLDGTWEWSRFMDGTEPDDIKLNSSTQVVLRGGWRAHLYTWTESFKYSPRQYAAYHVVRPATDGTADTVAWRPVDRLTNVGRFLRDGVLGGVGLVLLASLVARMPWRYRLALGACGGVLAGRASSRDGRL